jgi:glutamate-1-semialdehyde 2,1-aminomutase
MQIVESAIFKTFVANNQRSQLHAERARQVIPTGMSRALLRHPPFPAYSASGAGVHTTDLDGNVRLDFHGNYAALIHGHAHPQISAAVTDQLSRGSAYSSPASQELRLAEHLCSRVKSVQRVLFNNSGTEAVLVALRAARALTGRSRIGKFEGGYHGFSDYVMVGGHATQEADAMSGLLPIAADTHGLPPSVTTDAVLMRYNDIDSVRTAIERYGTEMAAIIVEPMLGSGGVIPAKAEFLAALREETFRAGIVLICDEVITLRQAYGGLQSNYALEPDLTTFAKIIGGGFPIGAVGGSASAMSVFDEQTTDRHVANLGTFSANPVSAVAGITALELLDEAAIMRLARLGERARQGLIDVVRRHSLRAQITGLGSMFQIHWTPDPVTDARAADSADPNLKLLTFLGLANRGIQTSMRGMCCLSTPMRESDVDTLVAAFEDTVHELSHEGLDIRTARP